MIINKSKVIKTLDDGEIQEKHKLKVVLNKEELGESLNSKGDWTVDNFVEENGYLSEFTLKNTTTNEILILDMYAGDTITDSPLVKSLKDPELAQRFCQGLNKEGYKVLQKRLGESKDGELNNVEEDSFHTIPMKIKSCETDENTITFEVEGAIEYKPVEVSKKQKKDISR